jgi:hypothetical protein
MSGRRSVLFPENMKLRDRCSNVVAAGRLLGRLLTEREVPKTPNPLDRFEVSHRQALEVLGGGWLIGQPTAEELESPRPNAEGEIVDWTVIATPFHGVVTNWQARTEEDGVPYILYSRPPRPITYEGLVLNRPHSRYASGSIEVELFRVRAIAAMVTAAVDGYGLRIEFGLTPQPRRSRA